MNNSQLIIMNQRSRIIALEKIIEKYRSSEKYVELDNQYKKILKEKDKEIAELKEQMARDSLMYKRSRRGWIKVNEEMYQQHVKELHQKDKEIQKRDKIIVSLNKELDKLYTLITQIKLGRERMEKELQKEKAKNGKLNAQINKNYENSSIPSSASPYRKKIENSREKTGRKQGGQIGHQGHRRKRYEPTNVTFIEPLDEYLDTTKYKPTGKMLKKQVINISLAVHVEEFQTPEFRNLQNRQRVHAAFPQGVVNEVNFGSSVEAIAFLLNNHYNVSTAKTCDFLSEISGGVFSMSTGCVNQLSKKFAERTKQQQSEIFDDLVKAPVMNTDFTTARVDGKLVQLLICATKDQMMFYGGEHKGFEGVEGSPVEYTTNILVHDHESTFWKYGGKHQECLVHVLRYLKGSMDNEKDLSWNKRMYETIQKMIHYAKAEEEDEEKVKVLVKEYDLNLEIAELNYKEHPPTKYYREGYNLAKRLREYRDDHLLFLYDRRVPYDNNLSERYARIIKRKMKQMTTFRSFQSFQDICTSLGVIETMRSQGGSLLEKVVDVFDM